MSEKNEIDEISGTETTGHEWDGIKELNTPLPRWWLWTFYACIIWAIGYMIAMPSWPLITGSTKGLLGYASRANVVVALDEAKANQAVFVDEIAKTDVGDIIANEELARFARAGGASSFKVNCSQCHGSGASGSLGYPNLNDDEWIWGGSIDAIYTTIKHGARDDADEDTLISEMSAFGADELLEKDEITAVANYVFSISGGQTTSALIANGAEIFTDNCAACHGENAEGVAELGGPALNNAIWLMLDGSLESITAQIDKPKHGVMPAWSGVLSDATVKQLAVYVHSLGGGQ
jgi:cytochrome c oxidase cbb3-type subunit 3